MDTNEGREQPLTVDVEVCSLCFRKISDLAKKQNKDVNQVAEFLFQEYLRGP